MRDLKQVARNIPNAANISSGKDQIPLITSNMKQPDVEKIAAHYSAILTEIGANIQADGIRETPLRAAKALVEMTEGSRMDTNKLTKMFQAECQKPICHDM